MLNIHKIRGQCSGMCPKSEIKMREQEKLLHPMEMLPESRKTTKPKADPNKIVKQFSRSAAGQNMLDVQLLRPYPVLLQTIDYLLDKAISNEDFPYHITYEFIADRIRGVRQDMTIQELPTFAAITLLEPIVRFYALSAYKLCHEPLKIFDPTLNNQHLQECLKQLLKRYDEAEFAKERNVFDEDDIDKDYCMNNRSLLEAVYLIFNLGEDAAICRGLTLPEKCRTDETVQMALKTSLAFRNNNYVRLCKLISQLPHQLNALAVVQLPKIRKITYEIMSIAYRSRCFPLSVLKQLLYYDDDSSLVTDLIDYNFIIEESNSPTAEVYVHFGKQCLIDKSRLVNPRKHKDTDAKLSEFSLREIVLTGL